jgi:tetratricopeptide (TPR) repeat protein
LQHPRQAIPQFRTMALLTLTIAGVIALAVYSGIAGAGTKKNPQARSWCMGKERALLDQQITGCTMLIRVALRKPKKRSLGVVFYNRGTAYFRKGQYDLAIADYDQAVNFGYTNALYNRSLAKEKLDDKAGAAADFAAFKSSK